MGETETLLKGSQRDGALGGSGMLARCVAVDDFYTFSARDTFARLCAGFLDEHDVSAIEVLYSPQLQARLEALPLLAEAINRVADQQAEAVNEDAKARRGELMRLAEDLAKLTRKRIQSIDIPEIKPQTFDRTVKAVFEETPGVDGQFRLNVALGQYLQSDKTLSQKLEHLIDLLESSMTVEAGRVLDDFLCDNLRMPATVADLFEGVDGLKPRIDHLISMVRREPVSVETAPKLLSRVAKALESHSLPMAERGLCVSLHRELASKDRLVVNAEGDLLGTKAMMDELMLIGEYARRLRAKGGFIGGLKTAELIDRRVSHLISDSKLQELLEGKSYDEKVFDLFALQKAVFGDYGQRIVNNYLLFFLTSREFAPRLLDSQPNEIARLTVLGRVQAAVSDSTFGDAEKKKLFEMLDSHQLSFITRRQIFSPLEKSASAADAPFFSEILDLAADGLICVPASLEKVREVLGRAIRRPPIIRGLLQGSADSREAADRLGAVARKLAAVGVSLKDFSTIKVLVVDDEEPARNLVGMVLTDMGFKNIKYAENGQQAWEVFSNSGNEYDLIVCDWVMPFLSGLDFLKKVRMRKPKQPFLMVTALATMPAVKEAMQNDVDGYIAKPFSPEQLEEKVLVLLHR